MERLLTEYSFVTGRHIGNLVNIFNPEAVTIGGDIARWSRFWLKIGSEYRRYSVPMMQGSYQLIFSEATENKVAKGASVLVQQHFLTHPHKYISAFERISS